MSSIVASDVVAYSEKMRSLLGKALPRSVALATFLACSEDTASPSIMLALNTNDLVISTDTNLVGLYVAELDQNGRVLATQAHEAAPLRNPDGTVEVPFPASLLLADATETRRVHVKLVAFQKDSRIPLTMRETRTQLPSSGQRLLRLNLFFVNQGNVVDSAPGAPVLEAAAASGLGFRHAAGPITQDQFARFTSLCDGAPAADGRTAGDDGRCVDLDIRVEDLPPRDDPFAPVPGASASNECFDVGRAFATWTDQVIGHFDRAALSALPTTGECRIDLPAVYDPSRLNVAMSTTENAFETHDNPFVADKPAAGSPGATQTLSLRPLPSGVSFRQEGNTIVVPAHVCAVLRRSEVQELLFSQRTGTWNGEDPVCAPWSHATVPHEFTGAAPGPLPTTDGGDPSDAGDGGDGGTTPAFADYALAAGTSWLESFAAGEGRVAFIVNDSDAMGPAVLAAERFEVPFAEYPRPIPSVVTDEVRWNIPIVRAMKNQGRTEFYLQGREAGGLWHLSDLSNELVLTAVDGLPSGIVAATPFSDGPAITWHDGEFAPNGRLVVSRLMNLTTVAAQPANEYTFTPNDPDFWLERDTPLGTSFGSELLLTNQYGGYYVQCTVGAGCERKLYPSTRQDTVVATAHSGNDTFSILSPGEQDVVLFHYETGREYLQQLLPLDQLVGGEGRFCAVQTGTVTPSPSKILCFTKEALDANAPRQELADSLYGVRLTSDDSSLYVSYECAPVVGTGVNQPVYVARMPWALVGQNPGAFVNRCKAANDTDAGDAGDGGPTMSTADSGDQSPQL